MNKSWFYLGLVGSLALAITSCGDGGKPAATPAVSPSPSVSTAASPSAVVPPAASTTTPVASATPATAATPSKPTKSVPVDVTAGLIAPTLIIGRKPSLRVAPIPLQCYRFELLKLPRSKIR
jgi:hypothetical protein